MERGLRGQKEKIRQSNAKERRLEDARRQKEALRKKMTKKKISEAW
jgi:hypothetical protein